MLFRILDHTVKIPYKFVFIYTEVAKRQPDSHAGAVIAEIYKEVFGIELTEEQLLEVGERLEKWAKSKTAEKATDKAASDPSSNVTKISQKSNSNTFAHRYAEWFRGLALDQALLWLSDYDPERAEYFYSSVDKDLVDMAMETKARNMEESNRLLFEAALFGNGGSYGKGRKGGSPGGGAEVVREHDCTKMTSDDIKSRLASLQRR